MNILRKGAGRKAMKTGLKGVTLLAALICVFAPANPAVAETLGDKIAAQLCFNTNTHSYSLTTADMALWTDMAVTGSHTGIMNGVSYVAHFSKTEQLNDRATCTKTKAGSKTGCTKWIITKSGWTLFKSSDASPCSD